MPHGIAIPAGLAVTFFSYFLLAPVLFLAFVTGGGASFIAVSTILDSGSPSGDAVMSDPSAAWAAITAMLLGGALFGFLAIHALRIGMFAVGSVLGVIFAYALRQSVIPAIYPKDPQSAFIAVAVTAGLTLGLMAVFFRIAAALGTMGMRFQFWLASDKPMPLYAPYDRRRRRRRYGGGSRRRSHRYHDPDDYDMADWARRRRRVRDNATAAQRWEKTSIMPLANIKCVPRRPTPITSWITRWCNPSTSSRRSRINIYQPLLLPLRRTPLPILLQSPPPPHAAVYSAAGSRNSHHSRNSLAARYSVTRTPIC